MAGKEDEKALSLVMINDNRVIYFNLRDLNNRSSRPAQKLPKRMEGQSCFPLGNEN